LNRSIKRSLLSRVFFAGYSDTAGLYIFCKWRFFTGANTKIPAFYAGWDFLKQSVIIFSFLKLSFSG